MNAAREAERKRLAAELENFLADGGVIQRLAPGEASAWSKLRFNPDDTEDEELPQGTHGVTE